MSVYRYIHTETLRVFRVQDGSRRYDTKVKGYWRDRPVSGSQACSLNMNSSLGRHSGNAVVTLSPKRSRGHDVACTTSPAAHLPALMAGSARCSTPALLSDRRQLRRGAEATVLSYHQRGLVLASRFSSGCFASDCFTSCLP